MESQLWEEIPLWEHQRGAINTIENYLDFRSRGGIFDKQNSSALVRMPTGTGKSGVIATLARCFPEINHVLVVSPWAALRDQLKRDIEYRFWQKSGSIVDLPPKDVLDFVPSTIGKTLEEVVSRPAVLLSTIQTLQSLYNDQPIDYQNLRNLVSIVIVDEGHREPAPEWAEAVRKLNLPTILFTATPYRNDNRMFNTNDRFTYIFTHHQALEKRFIRDIQFVDCAFDSSREKFVNQLLQYYYGEFQTVKPSTVDDPRVIIRCETSDEVNDIATILQDKGESVLAIHDRFSDNEDDYRARTIPNPEEKNIRFWVHQYKLVEGIDDPRFCLLAIFRPLRNARALIQQVGRVIRNPTQQDGQTAIVFSDPNDRQKAYWNGYRKYEETYNEHPKKYEPRQLFDMMIQLQPEYQFNYYDREFRERFEFDKYEGKIHLHLAFPLKTNIYSLSDEFSFQNLQNGLMEEWNSQDYDVRKIEKPDEDTLILIYQTFRNSPILLDQALLEFSVGFTILHKSGNILFYYDTSGISSDSLIDTAQRVPPEYLEKLFSGRGSRINQVTLLNCDLGRHSIRRKVLQAYSIEETAPNLVDYAHFYSTAHGYTRRNEREFVRRYVGFTRSRVSDPSSNPCEYNVYISWLNSIANALASEGVTHTLSIFNRFARHVPPPENPEPVNILFDLEDAIDDFEHIVRKADMVEEECEPFNQEETCYEVERNQFVCLANGERHTVNVSYNLWKHRYQLEAPSIEKSFTRRNPASNDKMENLISYINRMQAFRIVTPDGVVYAHNYFYKPKLKLWGESVGEQLDLLRVFHGAFELSHIGSEKGKMCRDDQSGWEPGSLFDYIDKLGSEGGLAPEEKGFNILICDDMLTESADFIAASTTERRVILIHAKAHNRATQKSASAFHDVCGQATKNIGCFAPYSQNIPANLGIWDGHWESPATTGGCVEHRIRRGTGAASEVWQQIREIIQDPSATKEVWLVLGQGFSIEEFQKERLRDNPRPEVIQIFFLLQSTWSAISSVGASLRIFCSP